MAKGQIGFIHGAPDNPDKTWEKQINGRTYIFTKTREKEGVFLYTCTYRSKSNPVSGFRSDRDLKPEEVEQRFAAFIAENT